MDRVLDDERMDRLGLNGEGSVAEGGKRGFIVDVAEEGFFAIACGGDCFSEEVALEKFRCCSLRLSILT